MREELEQAGLDPKEAQLYLAILALGQPTVAQAAQAAQVSRTNAYDVVRRLTQRGLVTVTEIGPTGERAGRGRGVLRATDPEQFLTEWQARGNVLRELVPRLKAVMSTETSRPRVRYLEGQTGITAALWETLTWGVPLKGILSMMDLLQVPGRQTMEEYIAKRRDLGITLNVVRSPEKETEDLWPSHEQDLRDVRFAPCGACLHDDDDHRLGLGGSDLLTTGELRHDDRQPRVRRAPVRPVRLSVVGEHVLSVGGAGQRSRCGGCRRR